MKRQQGFSLMELMIAVVIVGIISAVAIPNYRDYVTRSRIPEATAGLGDIRVRMEQFYQDNKTYPTGGCVVAPTAPLLNQLQVPLGQNFGFDCGAAAALPTGTTYTLKATGKGSMSGFLYTIDQFNGRATTFSGTAAANGWTSASPNNCWVTAKGGKC
jgi:type IV pilus assembly protein PilE